MMMMYDVMILVCTYVCIGCRSGIKGRMGRMGRMGILLSHKEDAFLCLYLHLLFRSVYLCTILYCTIPTPLYIYITGGKKGLRTRLLWTCLETVLLFLASAGKKAVGVLDGWSVDD